MTQSSSLHIDKRRRVYVRLIGDIRHALNQAFVEEHDARGLTRTEIADLLGTSKSFVTRKLTGTSNMTIETLADLAFALERRVRINLSSPTVAQGSNTPKTRDQPKTTPAPLVEKDATVETLAI